MNARRAPALPPVSFSELAGVRYLHLGTEWVQGSMRIARPFDIDLEYVQRMMAWLLFVPRPADAVAAEPGPGGLPDWRGLQALQLGLGAAALTKFCHQRLRMRTTAVELNAQVIAACRAWFRLPPDDARLAVIESDAAREIAQRRWLGTVDALQVDLYDEEAAAPVIDSPDFYRDCRLALSPQGAMTVNLFGRDASYERSLAHIVAAFGERAVWTFRPTREGNTIVLALREPYAPGRGVLAERASIIDTQTRLPARKWLRILRPLVAA